MSRGQPPGNKHANYRHGMAGTTIYYVWSNMWDRCRRANAHNYKIYGGRGVRVCDRWRSFEAFFEDVGSTYRPGLSIERRDVDGHYEPSNVAWIEPRLQARNRRNSKLTIKDAREIRRLRAAGWTYKQLAIEFGQSTGNMHAIVAGTRWKE